MWLSLLGPLLKPLMGEAFSAISTVLNRLLPPEKMSEKERAELDQEMEKLRVFYENRIEERAAESEKLFEQRVTAQYANPKWYRDIVRPIITLGWSGFYGWMKYKIITVSLSDGFQYPGDMEAVFNGYDAMVGLTIIGFWFGPKMVERLMGKGNFLKGLFNLVPGVKK
jgi:hypothetical protein